MSSAFRALDVLDQRLETLPSVMLDTLDRVTHHLDARPRELERARSVRAWDVVGVGASALPASCATAALFEAGFSARHVPLSAFLAGTPRPSSVERGLLVFSQGLSPNARLALRRAPEYATAWAVTAHSPEEASPRGEFLAALAPGLVVLQHPPAEEGGTLLRIVGPLAASVAGLLFVSALGGAAASPALLDALAGLPVLLRDERAPALPNRPIAWMTGGVPTCAGAAVAWMWQEGLRTPLAPAFDVLALSHGPLQADYDEPGTFALLTRKGSAEAGLGPLIGQVLRPEQRVVIVETNAPELLAPLSLSASTARELVRLMRDRSIDPSTWPGQGSDEPLYRIGE